LAKVIKFNLPLDGTSVRDISGLKESFNIDDLLAHFENGTLQRWCKVRGFEKELKAVLEISNTFSTFQKGEKLIEIFGVKNFKKEDIYHLQLKRERERYLEKIDLANIREREIISNYHKEYLRIKSEIDLNKDNFNYLKEAFSEIEKFYLPLFQLEAKELISEYMSKNILASLSILKNETLREYILNYRELKSKISDILVIRNEKIGDIYSEFKSFRGLPEKLKKRVKTFEGSTNQIWQKLESDEVLVLQSNAGTKIRETTNIENELSHVYSKGVVLKDLEVQSFKDTNYLKYILLKDIDGFIGSISTFRGQTDGYWKDLELADENCLILRIAEGSFIRSLGKHGEELSAKEVNGNFPLLKGIDYKSNSEKDTLYYLR
jgi:hypothetical protein